MNTLLVKDTSDTQANAAIIYTIKQLLKQAYGIEKYINTLNEQMKDVYRLKEVRDRLNRIESKLQTGISTLNSLSIRISDRRAGL